MGLCYQVARVALDAALQQLCRPDSQPRLSSALMSFPWVCLFLRAARRTRADARSVLGAQQWRKDMRDGAVGGKWRWVISIGGSAALGEPFFLKRKENAPTRPAQARSVVAMPMPGKKFRACRPQPGILRETTLSSPM